MGAVEAVAAAGGGTWEFYRDERGRAVVRMEIHRAGASEHERAMILAELKHLMRAALDGGLVPHLDLKHIARDPLIYELRLDLGADGVTPRRLYRLYFAWHRHGGPLRLALKFGGKPLGPDGHDIQNTHIDEASARYRSWLARHAAG
ncbi:hypothetical protein [Actinokineospora enzanensis]|uniref:hypothetical protein n=1 Tax=Actinokineospora enzanensis TaxID=155975 RepID=UPI000365E553|nr:hypothetical protein [Actinokineospora enzanensis]